MAAKLSLDELSCIDCAVVNCKPGYPDRFPKFCLAIGLDEQTRDRTLAGYQDEQARAITQAAALVEYEGYGVWPRVDEIMQFATRIGAHKIGIANCVGLINEARIFAQILRARGFEAFGVSCKVGVTPKTELGIDERCETLGKHACNPILQAELLEQAGTELNVVIGLCVGHDSLFYQHSHTLVTTLVTKDRVTGNNPAAALYTYSSYYHKLATPDWAPKRP